MKEEKVCVGFLFHEKEFKIDICICGLVNLDETIFVR